MHRLGFLCALLGCLVGCPEDTSVTNPAAAVDLAQSEPPCVSSPQTHVEILNACTSAQSVDKKTTLPLLRADGTLPPLP